MGVVDGAQGLGTGTVFQNLFGFPDRIRLQRSRQLTMFRPHFGSGRSVAWLARLVRVQEVVSSNLTAPTTLFPFNRDPFGEGLLRTWRNWQTRYFEVVVP